MKIQTSRFGELEIDEESVISIPGGLIGFPDQERYLILRHNPQSPFFWFQAVDRPDLAFVIVDPTVFKPDFDAPLPKALLLGLKASSPQEINTFVIVTIPPGKPEAMTANLLGPVVINTKTKLARQLVLDERQYSHCHPIMKAPAAAGKKASPSPHGPKK
ncbi:MAG: flagellar assembly protein FliW [Pseudomonadota bacterium]